MTSDPLPPKKPRLAAKAKPKRAKAAGSRQAAPKAASKAASDDSMAKKPVTARAPATLKPKRHCVSCESVVSMSARYCRQCGKALSPDVPTNPHLPPPPKPWRPSRIPRHRAAAPPPVAPTDALQGLPPPLMTPPVTDVPKEPSMAPIAVMTPVSLTGGPAPSKESPASGSGEVAKPGIESEPIRPTAPRVWDPVPEVEQKITQLRALHDRLRPQLARADLFKSRMRRP